MTTASLDEVTLLVAAPTVYDSSIVRCQNTLSDYSLLQYINSITLQYEYDI